MNTPLDWLDALRPSLHHRRWSSLKALDADLAALAPTDPGPADPAARSAWLLRLRRRLAGHRAPDGPEGPQWQAAAQFLAGYRDLDLREATGTGHGQMILDHAPPDLAAYWRDRLAAGGLVGIAATEAHGGSRIREITTAAVPGADGRWRINGSKRWVSRLTEAEAFVVFTRDPDGSIAAVVVDADSRGLTRQMVDPAGLGGWSWGLLHLDRVAVDPGTHLLGRPGKGAAIFRSHFARFRPLVTACALGAAAGVCDRVRATLATRLATSDLPRVRDNAMIALGQSWAAINAATLLAFHAARDGTAGAAPTAGKAHGVDVAVQAVDRLAPLIGAVGFQRSHPIAKARSDLAALQYADGIHDSLYRSAGKSLLDGVPEPVRDGGPAR
ncbi:acyl-CoA dehydrogenase family protein [Glycomyces xiaoerkulensis]|uniref:acyl-CoA dehydrogenase family protein n=1 Tax=Glycomyces xiaoerkulensis TaxID=2038139 RepID=UPI0018E40BF0|nr:acyl-CoA dehydrogenase [Glycomyces xiaoerkulensis]